jgi:hypothetical protein
MRSVGIAVLVAMLCLCGQAQAGIVVSISKAQQQLTVTVDGQETYRWPVSTGKPGYDTPSGKFTAFRTEEVYFSKKYDDAPMPNAVFFHEGYAVHGTLEQSKLGSPVSHGCVRLAPANAALLFALVKQRGMSQTRILVSDSPLASKLPDPLPVVKATMTPEPPKENKVARISAAVRDAKQDRGFDKWIDTRASGEPPRRTTQQTSGRDANLRAVYRKYGFTW